MRRFNSLFFAFLLMLPAVFVQADENWSLARDRDGIRVWTRDIPGYPIRGFKAVVTVKSTLSGLINLIMDTGSADQWIYRTRRIDVLKQDDVQGSFLIQVETDFPWPLTDRDVVIEGLITQDEKTGSVTVQSHSVALPAYPPREDFVRMPDMNGNWVFRPVGQGMVEVTMSGRADPGGRIPSGVINLIIHETPWRTLQGLRELIANPRYQKAVLPQIREP